MCLGIVIVYHVFYSYLLLFSKSYLYIRELNKDTHIYKKKMCMFSEKNLNLKKIRKGVTIDLLAPLAIQYLSNNYCLVMNDDFIHLLTNDFS